MPKALRDHDIGIASTGSALPVIGKGAVEAAIRQRRRRPIFMVDIAVPRDIEPEVGELPDVYLYSIDDLSAIVEGNRRQRLLEADSAESLIDQGARRFIAERRVRQGQRMLRQYRENAEDLQAAEVEKALQSLRNGAPPEVVLTRLGESLTRKLIHQPTVALRTASAEGRMDLLEAFKSVYALD